MSYLGSIEMYILEISGIEINEMKDIKAFADELTRKIDKYREISRKKRRRKAVQSWNYSFRADDIRTITRLFKDDTSELAHSRLRRRTGKETRRTIQKMTWPR